MTSELTKRIFTSVGLIGLFLFCFFTHPYFFYILITIVSIISWFELNNIFKKIKLNKNTNIFFSFLYLLFFIFIVCYGYNQQISIIFLLFVCIFSDIGGYIIGKTIGGKKLTKISPNKTISGSIGSFVFSLTPIFVYNIYDPNEYTIKILFFLLCLSVSLACQVGDLFISYLKRKAKIKDTGNILPGHGGILDRIDGIILAVPIGIIIFLLI